MATFPDKITDKQLAPGDFGPIDDLRNQFACAALTGLLSRDMALGQEDLLVKMAFGIADAMLKARLETATYPVPSF